MARILHVMSVNYILKRKLYFVLKTAIIDNYNHENNTLNIIIIIYRTKLLIALFSTYLLIIFTSCSRTYNITNKSIEKKSRIFNNFHPHVIALYPISNN